MKNVARPCERYSFVGKNQYVCLFVCLFVQSEKMWRKIAGLKSADPEVVGRR